MRQTLTKAERVRRRAEYLRIQGSGRKVHSPSFVLIGAQKSASGALTSRPLARLGITVSRRVGGAVVRNRLKRLVREAFRRHKLALPAGLDLVVIARPEAADVSYAQVERQLCEAFRRMTSGIPGGRSPSPCKP